MNSKQSTPKKDIVIKPLDECDYRNKTDQTQPIETHSLYSTLTPKPIYQSKHNHNHQSNHNIQPIIDQ